MSSEFKNYEALLIDDGSEDNSAGIISDYVKQNDRIKLILQENAGPSAARNKGLELAQGEIITFVDSDDYVSADYFEKIEETFKNDEVDVIFFEFCRVTSKGDIISTHNLPTLEEDYYHNLIALSENDIFGYTWVKAFSKRIINKTRFDESLHLYEDEVFSCQVLNKPVKIAFLNEILYYYVRTDNTLVHKTN